MDLLSINVDELEFDCTLDRYQDEIVHPETGETLREDFAQSGHKIVSQHPELFVCGFDQGGGYEFALGLREGAPPPEVFYVLFAGEKRYAFRITDEDKYAEDGITRIWEVDSAGYGVVCFSPFIKLIKEVERQGVTIVKGSTRATGNLFQSRAEQDQVIAIFSKAMCSYNHRLGGNISRRDGKPISKEEHKKKIELSINDWPEYEKIYKSESWMEKLGPAKVEFTDTMQSMLEKGSYIA